MVKRVRPPILVVALSLTVAATVIGGAVWAIRRNAAPVIATDLEHLGRYGEVPAFALTERSGRRVTLESLRGLVWVADFIYTECTESCPTQSLQFAQLQREFASEPDLRLVSITVDPAHDTREVLGRYAERYGATERWWFLTGDKRVIYCLAREGFRLGVVDPRVSEPLECGSRSWLLPPPVWASHGSQGLVMHSARVVLVDPAAQIRAYAVATDADSMKVLLTNLRAVLSEARQSRGG